MGPNVRVQGNHWRTLQLIAVLAPLYFCADHLVNHYALSDTWTLLWPLNGITIALLLMRRRRDWPAMMLGIAVGTGVGEYLDGNSFGFEVGQRLISLCEVFLSAWLLPSFDTFENWLRRAFIFYRFSAALLVGPGVSGVLAAILFHHVKGQPYLVAFNNWATADALGIAVTLPLILSFRSPELRKLLRRDQLAWTILVLALALTTAGIVFSATNYPLLFVLFPVLLFVESMLGFSGAAMAVFGVSMLAVALTRNFHGPFANWPAGLAISRDGALQIYLAFNILALFPASLLSMERRRMSAELIETNAELARLASMDGLTGIANRRVLDETFENEWKRAIRVSSPLAFLMVDIDHFKQFNDMYGHHAGDGCLKTVAECLQNNLQRSSDLVARFGGEEFAVLLPHTSLADAYELAEKIREAVIALCVRHEGSPFGCITVSIGCSAASPLQGESHLQLLKQADSALYIAKQVGRNGVQAGPSEDPARALDSARSPVSQ